MGALGSSRWKRRCCGTASGTAATPGGCGTQPQLLHTMMKQQGVLSRLPLDPNMHASYVLLSHSNPCLWHALLWALLQEPFRLHHVVGSG